MNKRYYEHTLPIIRGSLSNTYSRTRVNLSGQLPGWDKAPENIPVFVLYQQTMFPNKYS